MRARPLLSRREIARAFERLGDRLAARDIVADIHPIGGAVMILAYDTRPSTADIDAIWSPPGPVLEEAAVVASELGLPDWWLNEQASAYIQKDASWERLPVIDHPNIRVTAIAPDQLLAMKVLASRAVDAEDIAFLIDHLGLTSIDDVLAIVERTFPDEEVPPRAWSLLEDLFARPT
jgi:Nucleotidyltransferase of unknown function (DUF6036)